ncbi:hypothetical protein [Streptococcus cuniculipharyngis]|uniref:hypothetical protein n=1 Tax=Streptococcus cuniculipharyngis TaxID=1562651 RepID=UPI0016461A63|nr:hypothetical protein [Streptococcus cuniculipharyngis]
MSKVRLSVLDRLELLEAEMNTVLAENVELKARLDRLEHPTADNLMTEFLQAAK